MSSISWQQYFTFLGVATILYYLFVWIIYFKAKIPFRGKDRNEPSNP
jgi:hypothetical protein